jgi:hypothetical protein
LTARPARPGLSPSAGKFFRQCAAAHSRLYRKPAYPPLLAPLYNARMKKDAIAGATWDKGEG